jgi:hypothetical protein
LISTGLLQAAPTFFSNSAQAMKRIFVLISTILIFSVVSAFLYQKALKITSDQFVYTLDDPYIHLQMAKNLAENGSFGMKDGQFSSTSSSPFWTLLLAGYHSIISESKYAPLILNFIISISTILLVYLALPKKIPNWLLFLALILIIFASPLHALQFSGMEHNAQIAFCILFIIYAKKLFDSGFTKYYLPVFITAFLVTSIRFECSFLVFALAILLFAKKKRIQSLLLLFFGGLPILIYGLISLNNGWHFFPNSILLKAHLTSSGGITTTIKTIFFNVIIQLGKSPPVLVLFLISLIILIERNFKRKFELDSVNSLVLIFILTSLVHMQLGSIGWFYRYEAYLVALGIFVNSYCIFTGYAIYKEYLIRTSRSMKVVLIVAFAILLIPLFYRAVDSTLVTTKAQKNIRDQQLLMTQFVEQYYNNENIAVNDIGMVSYETDANIIDVWGLANNETGNAILGGYYNSEFFQKFLDDNNVKLVISYEFLFGRSGVKPDDWKLVATWLAHDNYVLGDVLLGFYAREEDIPQLLENLDQFEPNIHSDVIQRKFIQSRK